MKNCQEWLLGFTQAFNNIMSNKAPGLNPYEISCFLTDAQEAVAIGLYNGSFGKSFESTEDVTTFLAPLVRQAEMVPLLTGVIKIADNSRVYVLPSGADEILFVTLETCDLVSDCRPAGQIVTNPAIVVPITQDEYWRTVNDPFKRQNERKVLRLRSSVSTTDADGNLVKQERFELISDKDIEHYTVRYLTRPEPIILEDLKESDDADGLTIRGKWRAQTCLLDEALHQAILNEAVRMAKAVWQN